MKNYRIFTEQRSTDYDESYTACGIAVFDGNKEVLRVEDISDNEEKVSALAKIFNDEKLELSHLSQAIEDFLYDFEV